MSRLQLPRLVLLGQEQGEVHHPQEVERRRVADQHALRLQELGALQTQVTEQRALGGRWARERGGVTRGKKDVTSDTRCAVVTTL